MKRCGVCGNYCAAANGSGPACRIPKPDFHLARYGQTQLLHECVPNADISRRFGHTRFEAIVAPHDETCAKCLHVRDQLRATATGRDVPLIGVMIT